MRNLEAASQTLTRSENAKTQIIALLDQLAACTDSCSTDCQGARERGHRVAEKSPAPQKRIKRAPAPSAHDQKMIAQAHWWALMLKARPRLSLPAIEVPETTWRPDGERQIAAYKRAWREVFDGFWWEAADVALSELGSTSDEAEEVVRAAAPGLWAEYKKSGGNVDSLLSKLKKGSATIPDDPFFFPRENNPRRKKSKKKSRD